MATLETLNAALDTICDAYDKHLSDTRKAIYLALLKDLPDELLANAVKHVIGTCKFFPAVAEIRAAVGELSKLSHWVPSSAEAWSELVNYAHAPRKVQAMCHQATQLRQEIEQTSTALSRAVWERDDNQWQVLNEKYFQLFRDIRAHDLGDCQDCQQVQVNYQFTHPLIEQVARRLGWPDKFWSDEIGVDRGRFIKTYEAEVERLTRESLLLPGVREYVNTARQITQNEQAAFETGEQKQITAQYRALAFKMEA